MTTENHSLTLLHEKSDMFKKFKSIYNKENYDYSHGIVDPLEFHKTFYFFVKVFRVLDNRPSSKLLYLLKAFLVLNACIAFTLIALALYQAITILDIVRITECGTYIILFIYKLLILSSSELNLPYYHNFLKSMRKDFNYICTDGEKFRERFFESQLTTWKICIMCVVFMSIMSISMVLFATFLVLFYVASHDPNDRGNRPLLFPLWAANIDFTETPIYEIISFFSSYTILLQTFAYVFMIQTGIVWVRQITIKADLVIYCLEDLMEGIHPTNDEKQKKHFDELLKTRLRDIVLKHHYMYRLLEDFAGVYKIFFMYEQKLGAPVVCMTAYGSAEKLASGEIHLILMLLCVTTITVVFIPSLLCTFLGSKVRSIRDACWNIPFWNAGPVVRPYLVIIMQRSLRPLPLQAPGFEEFSLQTFSSKMGSAYSMFNMLRQTNLGH